MNETKSVRTVLLADRTLTPEQFMGKLKRTVKFEGLLYEKRGYAHKGILQVGIETYDARGSGKEL